MSMVANSGGGLVDCAIVGLRSAVPQLLADCVTAGLRTSVPDLLRVRYHPVRQLRDLQGRMDHRQQAAFGEVLTAERRNQSRGGFWAIAT